MNDANIDITLEQYLKDLGKRHPHCLLHLDVNWSGHARLYRNMVEDICRQLQPPPQYLHHCLEKAPFNQMKTLSSLLPVIYYLKGGELMAVIEGIHARHHFLERIQLLHQNAGA